MHRCNISAKSPPLLQVPTRALLGAMQARKICLPQLSSLQQRYFRRQARHSRAQATRRATNIAANGNTHRPTHASQHATIHRIHRIWFLSWRTSLAGLLQYLVYRHSFPATSMCSRVRHLVCAHAAHHATTRHALIYTSSRRPVHRSSGGHPWAVAHTVSPLL